jgi:hypothetical protein
LNTARQTPPRLIGLVWWHRGWQARKQIFHLEDDGGGGLWLALFQKLGDHRQVLAKLLGYRQRHGYVALFC